MMTMDEIRDFYHSAFETNNRILRSILDDRDAYIKTKAENPAWSDFTLEMGIFSNQAMRMLSILKYSFGIGPHGLLDSPAFVGDQQVAELDEVIE